MSILYVNIYINKVVSVVIAFVDFDGSGGGGGSGELLIIYCARRKLHTWLSNGNYKLTN